MKYNFIEAGTGQYSSYIDGLPPEWNGILVEPIQEYPEILANKPNIIKIFGVAVPDDTAKTVDLYGVPVSIIEEYNLNPYLRGMNNIGGIGQNHINWSVEHLVEKTVVPATTLQKVFTTNNVEAVLTLKLNSEGLDTEVLQHFLPWLSAQPKSVYPKRIEFRDETATKPQEIENVINAYTAIGYQFSSKDNGTVKLFFKA